MAMRSEVEVEIRSSAKLFWAATKESSMLFPEIFPKKYKSIEIIQGDGISPGSIRLIKYNSASSVVTIVKERIDAVDEENKTVVYSVVDGELATFYKDLKATVAVADKGSTGAVMKLSIEYEKATDQDQVPDPKLMQEFAVKTFTDLDSYLAQPRI